MTTAPAPLEDYQVRFSGSAALHGRAAEVLAGGAAHDLWDTHPFPVYFERAKGPYKWDHENNRFIDFWTGHGAHLCGHEPVQEAVAIRLGMGTHLTAPAEAQIRWAEQVCTLVPSAERVRFTSSGTEATMLALRVARAHTGRRHVIKFDGHFHGWHDEVLSDYSERSAAGRHPLSGELRSLFPCTDIAAACRRMEHRDVAAAILEPGGGSSGALPWSPEDLRTLREAATRTVTPDLTALGKILGRGFPVSGPRRPAVAGVTPDLTALGGGFPGAALAGRGRGPGAAHQPRQGHAHRHLQRERAVGHRRRRNAGSDRRWLTSTAGGTRHGDARRRHQRGGGVGGRRCARLPPQLDLSRTHSVARETPARILSAGVIRVG